MKANESFWAKRFHMHGHTGWADPVIYAYDQQERLALIKAAIATLPIQGGNALDFGCGTGDFSKLLLSMGFDVCGFDPFANPHLQTGHFTFAKKLSEITLPDHSGNLAIAITVLDHILDEGELLAAMKNIQSHLKSGAPLLMLEYALDSATDRQTYGLKNAYQSFRTLAEWKSLLERSSFQIEKITPMPHPVFCPSHGYRAYSNGNVVHPRSVSLELWRL